MMLDLEDMEKLVAKHKKDRDAIDAKIEELLSS